MLRAKKIWIAEAYPGPYQFPAANCPLTGNSEPLTSASFFSPTANGRPMFGLNTARRASLGRIGAPCSMPNVSSHGSNARSHSELYCLNDSHSNLHMHTVGTSLNRTPLASLGPGKFVSEVSAIAGRPLRSGRKAFRNTMGTQSRTDRRRSGYPVVLGCGLSALAAPPSTVRPPMSPTATKATMGSLCRHSHVVYRTTATLKIKNDKSASATTRHLCP